MIQSGLALLTILKALSIAIKRDLGSFESLKLNNFFLFVGLLIWGALVSGVEPVSAEPLLMLLGFLLLFPLSSDPLGKIPPDRLAAWPISVGQRIALRLISFALSPVVWVAVAILLKTGNPALTGVFVLIAVAIQVSTVMVQAPQWNPLRRIPQFPGRIGGLVLNNLRQMFMVLDTYVAILMSAGGCAYRYLATHPDPAAFPIIAVLVGLALSTYAQCLFGLDLASSAVTRYRLLPLPGWKILLAKDIAFLAILVLLILPLDLFAGVTFGLTALAVGHHSSVLLPVRQKRWRFMGSRLFPGVVQALGGTILGFAEFQRGPGFLVAAGALYAFSLFFYGRCWDRSEPHAN